MTYPAPLLPDLLVGWQTVGDQNNLPIYVFRMGDICHAARSKAQRIGYLRDTLALQVLAPGRAAQAKDGVTITRPLGGERAFADGGNDE
jgi:hypothetical protein